MTYTVTFQLRLHFHLPPDDLARHPEDISSSKPLKYPVSSCVHSRHAIKRGQTSCALPNPIRKKNGGHSIIGVINNH